jgi:hypothetical protein
MRGGLRLILGGVVAIYALSGCMVDLGNGLGSDGPTSLVSSDLSPARFNERGSSKEHRKNRDALLLPTGGNWRWPQISRLSVSIPYASSNAPHKLAVNLGSSNYNDGGWPTPNGYEVVWYGALSLYRYCGGGTITFNDASLTAVMSGTFLSHPRASYTLFYYDFYGNPLGSTELGSPKNQELTFPTPLQNSFQITHCFVVMELAEPTEDTQLRLSGDTQ